MPSGMASTTRVPTRFSTASTQWPTSSNTSGIRVWHSLRPAARVNHTSDESEGAPMSVIKPALDPKTVEVVSRSGYPEPFRARVMPRHKRPLGDALGLTRIGVNLTMLPPGKESSMRHLALPAGECPLCGHGARAPGQRPAAAAVPVVVNDGLAEDLLDLEPRALSAERSRADRDAGDAVGAGARAPWPQDPRRRDPPPCPTEPAAWEPGRGL